MSLYFLESDLFSKENEREFTELSKIETELCF